MNTDFPEDEYRPVDYLADRYHECVLLGHERMKSTSVVVCGLARNVEAILPLTIARIERLVSMFGGYNVIVYENDSTDRTPDLLKEWMVRDSRVVVHHDVLNLPINPGTRCLDRAQRMADARNKYLDLISRYCSHVPFTIMLDMDLLGGWSYDGIAHTFSRDGWDMVGSNGILHQYNPAKRLDKKVQFDAWAFRTLGRPDPHPSREVNPLWFNRGEPLIPMESCFGGLGVYRTEAALRSRYTGGDCEHVPFHLGMGSRGRIFLNPSQIVLYGQRDW